MYRGEEAESGAQLIARIATKLRPSLANLSPEIFPRECPKFKEIIEITGESNIGKTMHLMELIALAIIPSEFGGKGSSVIIIDTNSNFHVPFLLPKIFEKHILHHHQMAAKTAVDTEDMRGWTENIHSIVLNSMKNIVFFKCYSNTELELVLLNCHEILKTNMNISLLAIDSIATFYWSDLINRQQPIRMETYLKQLLKQIRNLTEFFGIVAVYTKPKNFGSSSIPREEPVEYKIQLNGINGAKETKEARLIHGSNQSSRNYSINDFGIEWNPLQNK